MTNVSFDGSPVQFRLDSSLLAWFDPLALDIIRDSLPEDSSVRIETLLERVNVDYSAMACCSIPDFRPGTYRFDPRDIQKFGEDDEDFDYSTDEQAGVEPLDNAADIPFVAVDSATLIIADVAHLVRLVNVFTWEKYDLALQNDNVFGEIVDALGGAFFALIHGGCMPGMQFDGDGMYTIPPGSVRPSRG